MFLPCLVMKIRFMVQARLLNEACVSHRYERKSEDLQDAVYEPHGMTSICLPAAGGPLTEQSNEVLERHQTFTNVDVPCTIFHICSSFLFIFLTACGPRLERLTSISRCVIDRRSHARMSRARQMTGHPAHADATCRSVHSRNCSPASQIRGSLRFHRRARRVAGVHAGIWARVAG